MTWVLRTPQDVAEWLNVPHSESTDIATLNQAISSCVYRHTDCGAWAEVVEQRAGERRTVRWTATLERLMLGQFYATNVRRTHGGRSIEPQDAPPEVRSYLQLDAVNRIVVTGEPTAFFAMLKAGESGIIKVTRQRNTWWVTFEVNMLTHVCDAWVFRVGSIIEGSDVVVEPAEVILPCHGCDIEQAIEAVDQSACELWNEVHSSTGEP